MHRINICVFIGWFRLLFLHAKKNPGNLGIGSFMLIHFFGWFTPTTPSLSAPKGNDRIPTIHFQRKNVSFRRQIYLKGTYLAFGGCPFQFLFPPKPSWDTCLVNFCLSCGTSKCWWLSSKLYASEKHQKQMHPKSCGQNCLISKI